MTMVEAGKKIEETRKALGLTQVQLAELAEISYRTVIQLEAGRSVRLDTLLRICDTLGLDINLVDRGGMA